MQVKLLKDFVRGGKVKVVARRGRAPIAHFAGAIVDVSPGTAEKWIQSGQAEAVKAAQ